MTGTAMIRIFVAIAVLWLVTPAAMIAALAQSPGGAADRGSAKRPTEEVIRIPRAGTKAGIVTRICHPRSAAPAPLVVINHGRPAGANKEERERKRRSLKPYPCGIVAHVFTSRGYVVASPVRRGSGETGGDDRENSGPCDRANFISPANAGADDVQAVIEHLKTLSYVKRENTIVVGQSVGGLVTMALASRNLKDVSAYINFAGGHGGHRGGKPNNNCSPGNLVTAAAYFGKTVRSPMLWIYTENDSFFAPELSRRMHAAFTKEGGSARFEMLPPFRTAHTNDGHNLLFGAGGYKVWEPIVIGWLDATMKKR